jgi:DNA-binding LacI/PurR family transcriptional regulator
LRDIARRAGVHHTTASRALKNDPRIHGDTLARIKAIAAELGYAPDPMLSALNAYRQAGRTSQYHGTVAWITNYPARDGWRSSYGLNTVSCYELYYRGASEQLARHGYRLEEFWLHEPGMTARRSSQVLLHRGIRGLLLCPLPVSRGHLSLQWEKFSAVTFGYSLARPMLHLFSAAHFRAVITCVRKLRIKGYRRIGMVTSVAADSRMDGLWTAAYRAALPTLPESQTIPIHLYLDGQKNDSAAARKKIEKDFLKWFEENRPEVIVTTSSPVVSWLRKGGYDVPRDAGVVTAAMQEGDLGAGIVESSREIGRAAADFLVGMLQRGERGIPRVPQRVLLEGSWSDGNLTANRMPSLSAA